MERVVVIDACRTPFGKFGGSLRDIPVAKLGALVLQALLQRTGLPKEEIQQVIFGTAFMAGAGYTPARQAAIFAGLSPTVDFLSLNNACASAARAVNLAMLLIQTGRVDTVIAGGMENMSSVPYFIMGARWGEKMGHRKVVDGLLHDGLIDAFYQKHMGEMTEEVAREYEIGRDAMDFFALRSHKLAAKAWKEGAFAQEVIPVSLNGKGEVFQHDEGVRADASLDKLAQLKPAFLPNGAITAGNASALNDGAAALLLMSESKAKSLGLNPLATLRAGAWASLDSKDIAVVPAHAIRNALEAASLTLADCRRIEINEAFAAVPLVSSKVLECTDWEEKMNCRGGAVAIGHPVAASGARILMSLIYELRGEGGGVGVAGICGAGCSGDAVVVEV